MKHTGCERLIAVGKSFRRFWMHLYDQPVGAAGNRGTAHGQYKIGSAGAVTWIHDDGKMGKLFHCRHDIKIEGIACKLDECTNSPLTEYHTFIPTAQDVLGA